MSKRRDKGLKLLAEGKVLQVKEGEFVVKSEKGDKEYRVVWNRDRWTCECPDFKKGVKCKHIYASMYYLAVRDVKNAATTLKEERTCKNCGRDDEVIKKGIRYNKSGPVQMYYCKRCGKKFSARTGFGGMKKRAEAIVAALDLYFRGLSLRQVAQHLKASYNVEVCHKTVHNWIKRYVKLVNEFVKSVNLDSSARWHVDDSVIKVKGDHIRIWTLLDSETRFILAIHISKSRGAEEALKLLKKGLEVSKKPEEIVSDGLKSYEKAISQKFSGVIHIQSSLREGLNNRAERFFKELKRRVKVMDGFKTRKGAETFVEGYRIYYNFIKKHSSLNDRTPAQSAALSEDCSWLELILRASKR